MIDVRCKNCNRLLLKAAVLHGAIKCHSCRMIFEYHVYGNLSLTNAADPAETKALLKSKPLHATNNVEA